MDTLTEDFGRSDVDTEMRVLTPEDITEQHFEVGDDVENLRNSLREAVHDENVQPKMQCLMMDSSFSMVTMQGEDSGIAWETTPSRCNTPWTSDPGNLMVDFSSPVAVQPTTPGSQPAGKIIFVMDEELMTRRKKTKERSHRNKPGRPALTASFDNISGRRELIEFSQPNVKIGKRRKKDDEDDEEYEEDEEDEDDEDEEEEEEEPIDPVVDKEQRLFSLVSEGSEILNIIVPPKLTSVDEEESKEMVDNLSYLEETPVPKVTEEPHDIMLDLNFGLEIPTQPPTESSAAIVEQPLPVMGPNVMDPPGAPVARPRARKPACTDDYFEPFTLIDAQAPGSPTAVPHGQEEPEEEDIAGSPDVENSEQSEDNTTTANVTMGHEMLDTISLGEITSDLLDEVFYGGTDNDDMKTVKAEGGEGGEVRSRLPSKPSGSNLFGSQEEILTPVFIPEGPPKIIDPILLEEPKAMAFLYTDLYEDAVGSRQKEDDTESMTSEKSFHSRHSDREARGYLEKYALIDETPVVEVEPTEKEERQEDGSRILYQNLYDYAKPEKGDTPNFDEEVTDFFRSSANSSPCDIEPFPRSLEEDEEKPTTNKVKEKKSVSIKVETVAEMPEDPYNDLDFTSEDLEWGSEYPADLEEAELNVYVDEWKEDLETQKPVAPPRRKATSSPKACLDLTPLTPVEIITQEKEEACGKEQREEEKETASPVETPDEGDENGAKAKLADASPSVNAPTKPPRTENVKDSSEIIISDTKSALAEEKDTNSVEEVKRSETEAATKQTEPEKTVDIKSPKSAKVEAIAEKQGDNPTTLPSDQAKRQCIIL